ncbi:2OG-Fe(II) oxygenase [Burkholderia thailandensis]|uniref:2OG-Fe(II) oxygenase superfamily protein n=1 Tax=Burkholderia thailandensis TaxID=57975 RepID=A0AAW9CVT5_BURTH|nr:2OG-Fe(II) oxygenase [Burkholderia thailandensis]AHI67869.1 2OG-Fe(II) oxygenase superfamily protein [Burkholderia thailandensis H0587]AIP65987.1 2OG-Fe(II) oxygenase [Burkholderia thailandensis]AJY30954.1 2OG-Fe(II) oxygenase superfamily protein [Burkholderia thailandensis 34]AOI55084.1 2OG-Fe(II) oxygenase [Burkholderia thailandensis]AOJ54117.1 2OG-Fe(II) oxygenase [Burkholderia thailandensis]
METIERHFRCNEGSAADYAAQLREVGTVMLPAYVAFDAHELARIDALQARLPEEPVTAGDAGDTHDIYVRRIMVDRAGERPQLVNRPHSEPILALLTDARRTRFFGDMFGANAEYFIRRCQINRMLKDSFIGLHLDAASNPDYEFSVVIQLGREFDGGEFVVHPEGRLPNVFAPTYGTVIVTSCMHRHEVRPVRANERTSLVYFYARHNGVNRRAN